MESIFMRELGIVPSLHAVIVQLKIYASRSFVPVFVATCGRSTCRDSREISLADPILRMGNSMLTLSLEFAAWSCTACLSSTTCLHKL